MATLTGDVQFTGTMGDFIAYRLPGSDRIIIRRKGGPDKQKLKKHRNYEITRLQNQEWKACVEIAKLLNGLLFPLKHLANYNYTGSLTGLCKSMQKDDTVNVLGKRSVLLSQSYYKLEGFSLNKHYHFESFVKHPLQYSIDKPNALAVVQWPDIVPGINLTNPNEQPLYRFVFVVGAVADIVYREERKMYMPLAEAIFPVVAATAWHTAKQVMEAGEVSLAFDNLAGMNNYSLVLAAGIEFGVPVSNTEVRPVKRDGAAKVLRVG